MIRRLLHQRRDEDGFALVLSLLLIMVVAGLSLGMAAVVLDQARPTLQARKTTQTVNAAQSGMQVALQSIRAANDGANNGVLSKLPCTGSAGASFTATGSSTSVSAPGTTYTGAVAAAAGTGTPTYRVSVAYYRLDPTGQTPTWLHDNAMPCPLTSVVPLYAYLQSYGGGAQVAGSSATQGNRNQVATYTFSTSTFNVVGGRLRLFGQQLCVDAGSSPAVGTAVTFQPCLALGTPQQTWGYRPDLTLYYGGNTSLNLCLQASASATTATLQTCTGSGTGSTYGYTTGQQVQEWGLNDHGHFASALDDGTVTNEGGGPCLEPSHADGGTRAVSGAALLFVSCTSTEVDADLNAFDPDPQVGAGKAGGTTGIPTGTKQYVNYAQFGRCLDISGQDVKATNLIVYPCKQAPDSSKLTFNQVWDYTATTGGYGTFSVQLPSPYYANNNQDTSLWGKRYCLTAPGSGSSYPVVTECQASPAASQLWQPTGDTGDYRLSYNLVSQASGSCLAANPLNTTNGNSYAAEIVVAACDGSAAQKWNAPPHDADSGLGNIHEPTGG